MARTVADVALLDAIMAGTAPEKALRLDGLRLGLPRAKAWTGLDSETEAVASEAVGRMREAGVTFTEVALPGLKDGSRR